MFAAAQDHSTAGVLFLGACAFVALLEWRLRRGRYRLHLPLRRVVGRRPEDNFTDEQRAEILENCDGRCFYCGVPVHYGTDCEWVGGCNTCFEADHYVAVANGGPTTVENGVAACRFHNRGKGSKTVEKFLAGGGRR